MQQVADWLEKLGLGQYAQRFAENDISFSILPDLTDQHLEKMGVASLGHRLQLKKAADTVPPDPLLVLVQGRAAHAEDLAVGLEHPVHQFVGAVEGGEPLGKPQPL